MLNYLNVVERRYYQIIIQCKRLLIFRFSNSGRYFGKKAAAKKVLPIRDSNPGLPGESRV